MEAVVSALLAHGPLGIALVALGYAFWKQGDQLKEVQAARVEDAKKTVTTLLELVEKQHGAIRTLAEAVQELRGAFERRGR